MTESPYFNVRISSPFGLRVNPLDPREEQFHRGIDFVEPKDRVYAGLSGRVRVGYGAREGHFVQISRMVNNVLVYLNLFHNDSVKAKPGDRVNHDQIVAVQGATGTVTGKHIHLEIFTYDYKTTLVDEIKKTVDFHQEEDRLFFDPLGFMRFLIEKGFML